LRSRVYVPDADMGTEAPDVRRMMAAVGLQGRSREWRENHSGFYTAISCAAALRAMADRRGLSLAGARIAIEGFGSVGSSLAMVLAERGAAIVAVSTARGAVYQPAGLDLRELLDAVVSRGSAFVETYPHGERLPREALFALPIDVLCPCARYRSLHPANVEQVQAGIICAGANNPVHPAAERLLAERGVLVAPDFVSNCGGVLGGTLEFAGLAAPRIGPVVDEYVHQVMSNLMEWGERRSQPLRERIEVLARRHHAATRSVAEGGGTPAALIDTGLEAFRRGWLPPRLIAPLALRSIRRRLLDPAQLLRAAS
jgi:glutamate dehydrogenase (NAD(P)+)